MFQAFGCQKLSGWRQEISGVDDEGRLRRWARWLKWNRVNDGCERSLNRSVSDGSVSDGSIKQLAKNGVRSHGGY